MPLKAQLSRIRQALTEGGLWSGLQKIARSIRRKLFLKQPPTHPFDLLYGTDTSGLIHRDKLSSGHVHDANSTAYWGTAPSVFAVMLQHWEAHLAASPHTLAHHTFIDIGCGKGRVVMLASDAPFRHVMGVELNPHLAAAAQQNLAIWTAAPHSCPNITVLHADALTFPFPETPVLLYLYNPFDAHVMQLLLDRLAGLALTRTAPIDILYAYPIQRSTFAQHPGVLLLEEMSIPYTREEVAADAFGGLGEHACLYRIAPSS